MYVCRVEVMNSNRQRWERPSSRGTACGGLDYGEPSELCSYRRTLSSLSPW